MKIALTTLVCALFVVGGCHAQQVADEGFLNRQSAILKLLTRINSANSDEEQSKISRTYIPGNFANQYKDPEALEKFLENYNSGKFLKRDSYFSLFDDDHRSQMISFFELLHGAPTWETFYKTACWGRDRLNQGIFVYAFSAAVVHRSDLRGIRLPPPYEINPHFFAPTTVIHEAYRAKMKGESKVIPMNFTGTTKNYEQQVAYFGEDVEMNSHHYHWHLDFPFWWKQEYGQPKDRKGELFFYMHHQLTARYDHERLSNRLEVVEPLGWGDVIEQGFAPLTSYKKEGDFPVRPDNMKFSDLPGLSVQDMKNFEERIRKAVDAKVAVATDGTPVSLLEDNGIDILGSLMESSEDSVNPLFYGSLHNFAHKMLARLTDPDGKYGMPPGVMEHFETATRDPAFFKLHKYMDNIFKKYKDTLPPYTSEELSVPGVTFNSIDVRSKSRAVPKNTLITYFDDFHFNLENSLDTRSGVDDDVKIIAKVRRLDHEDFTYEIDATSDTERVVTVRIFLKPETPKRWGYRWMLTEMDKFTAKLKPGKNTIYRESKDSSVTVEDRPGFDQLRKEVKDALEGKKDLIYDDKHRHCGQPDRLLLPRGNELGMSYELIAVFSDWEQDKVEFFQKPEDTFGGSLVYCSAIDGKYPDKRAMGFPFDRLIKDEEVFSQANMAYRKVVIKHFPDA